MEHSSELATEIAKIISDTLFVEVNSPEDDLLANGTLDSVSLIQLLFQMEGRFGIKIALNELELDDIRSIASISRLVANNGYVREAGLIGAAPGRAAD